MGEAKRRGSREERVAQALSRKVEPGVERRLEAVWALMSSQGEDREKSKWKTQR